MPETLAPTKREVGKFAMLAALAAGAVVATRHLGARKVGAAERLTDALLDTEKLREAAKTLPDGTETTLAGCAAYIVSVAFRAAEGLGAAGGTEDAAGFSRTHKHPYTNATASVLTETAPQPTAEEGQTPPEASPNRLTYSVSVPDVAEVRGTRRIGARHLAGLSPARPTPDTVQISLADGYTAQLETEFEVGDYLFTGRTRLFGAATLRDNRGNAGHLNIAYDGTITGTITRDAKVVGRFEGRAATGLNFRQYQLEGGS